MAPKIIKKSNKFTGKASLNGLTVGSTRTPTLVMPSAFLWPVLVPSALAGSGAG